MRRLPGPVVALLIACTAIGSAIAAPPGPPDPDWPCQQIKVPRLSLAAIWSGPPPEQPQTDPAVADLVRETAKRRLPIEQAQNEIHDFARRAQDK